MGELGMETNARSHDTDVVFAEYETPRLKIVSDDEVLRLFQITASEIGAAAVWWSASCSAC